MSKNRKLEDFGRPIFHLFANSLSPLFKYIKKELKERSRAGEASGICWHDKMTPFCHDKNLKKYNNYNNPSRKTSTISFIKSVWFVFINISE